MDKNFGTPKKNIFFSSRMDSDSDDQLLEDDEFPDIGMELSFANRVPPKPGIRDSFLSKCSKIVRNLNLA